MNMSQPTEEVTGYLHNHSMNAVVFDRYGAPDELEMRVVAKPVPGDGDVLLKVAAVSVQPLDWHFLRGKPYLVRLQAGLRRPKRNILGSDVAGTVEAIGKNVTSFSVGDPVFGEKGRSCAEYVSGPEHLFAPIPGDTSFEAAASIPVAGFTALQGLRDRGGLESGQSVLINGASGGVGTFAIQIAKALGAEVTAVCSTRNVEIAKSIGADHVIDYTAQDFTRTGEEYDLIFDTAANRSLTDIRRALKKGGTYVSAGAPPGNWVGPIWWIAKLAVASMLGSYRMKAMLAKQDRDDLITLAKMVDSGQVVPVIDRTYSLAGTPEAIRYVEDGHAQGKVIITI